MSTRANQIIIWLAVTAISVTIGMTARDPVIASVLISVAWAAATKLLTAPQKRLIHPRSNVASPPSDASECRTESGIINKLHALQWMKVLLVYAVVLNVAVGWRLWNGTASAEMGGGTFAPSPPAQSVSLDLGKGWSVISNDLGALFHARHDTKNMEIYVFGESKASLPVDANSGPLNIEQYYELMMTLLSQDSSDMKINAPVRAEVGRYPAIGTETSFISDGESLVMGIVIIEAGENFYQVRCIASRLDYALNRSELQRIASTFVELK
jgi:hypothetical protein